ncbi:MAG TPA: HAD family phosphatase [Kofleriaceae bacterium]|nr:HAD family phosphatase [Kofleriaceae bacterium]
MLIRALLFDLDGTLVDTERESAEAMARALRTGLGMEITQAERDFMIGRSWVEIDRNLRAGHPGLSWSRDQLIAATAAERVRVFADVGLTVLPGALEAVRRFANVGRALVTGSSREEAGQVLDALGLRGDFDVVVASEDVPRSKPEPDGYLAAMAAIGVEPRECVVVEDSAAGVAAGLAAGAWVVGVRAGNFHGQDQSAAHVLIETLDELTQALFERSLLR